VGQAFGDRYHIIRVLGIGGMGAVYHTWDAELGMAVALKVIRPDSSTDPAAAREMERRFKQELVLARQVTHKNVVRIHDLGEIDGIKYITMPYLEGSDLSTVLKEAGKMPVPAALGIVRDVAAGLVAAHEAGIVHRDLKPANIMVLKDCAVIMDFGIARSNLLRPESASHLAPKEALDSLKSAAAKTVVGTILGTVQYMAPEQARGQAVDQRADVYALGLIFLDMLLGKRHTQASSAIEELKSRMEQPPPLAQTLDPTIPKPIEEVIARCLQPDAAARYQTSAELVAALDRLDEKGELIPIKRVVRLPYVAAGVALLLAVSVGVLWYQRQFIPPPVHDPVSVVIADFQNTTSDPNFENTLEQSLQRGLAEASFITAFDRTRIRPTFGVTPPEKFDETAARQLAINQGLGLVVAGAIAPQGDGYDISVQATQPLTGNVVASFTRRASSKDQVLDAMTRVVASVRSALGDETSNSNQLLGMRSISTTSLEVASLYAAALEAQSMGRVEEALGNYSKAVQLDQEFGLGYQGLAVMSRNLGRLQESQKYAGEALRYLDKMTERERLTTRGYYYIRTGDYQQCVKEYGDLTARYPADVVAHNQRAVCLARLRDMRGAVEEMRQVVKVLPGQQGFRTNLALFLSYAGDFAGAEKEIRSMKAPNDRAIGALAISQLGQGLIGEVSDTYKQLSAWGAVYAAAGLADLAVYQGRFAEAVRLFETGITADLAAKNQDAAAMKLTALAYAHLASGQKPAAIAAANRALQNSTAAPIRFLVARIFVEAGVIPRAQVLAKEFMSQFAAESQAYGKIIQAGIVKNEDRGQAIKLLNEANQVLDTWFGHFDLGRAYFEAGAFPQADSEFDRCIQRRGEALAVVDEDPTYGYFPILYYYQGRVREEMKTSSFADSYREYLKIRGESKEDPLVTDIGRRVGI
jgi:serine/threonine protein kinase/tetratricopeptide (TPR) repeat protein